MAVGFEKGIMNERKQVHLGINSSAQHHHGGAIAVSVVCGTADISQHREPLLRLEVLNSLVPQITFAVPYSRLQ